MSVVEIPLRAADQSFRIPLGGQTYTFTLFWNNFSSAWVLNVGDQAGVQLVGGIPLVTGADLLSPFPYLGIGGSLYVRSDREPDRVPTMTNLGIDSHLYFVTAD